MDEVKQIINRVATILSEDDPCISADNIIEELYQHLGDGSLTPREGLELRRICELALREFALHKPTTLDCTHSVNDEVQKLLVFALVQLPQYAIL